MNRTGNGIVLCEDPHDFLVMQNLYDAAVRQLTLKFNILNSEFNVLYARNPIHHIDGRVKSQSSIVAKLVKKGLPVSIESARENVNDIAGVRVVCSYIDDVYRVAEMFERQTDVEIVKKQDYIKTPNYNGYRSLHLDIKVPSISPTGRNMSGQRSRSAPLQWTSGQALSTISATRWTRQSCPRASTRRCSSARARSPRSTARCRICTSASRLRTLTMRTEPPQREMHRHERAVNLIKNGGVPTMKIAVTYENGMIFQHFGHTEQFKIYEVAENAVVHAEVVNTNGSDHGCGHHSCH